MKNEREQKAQLRLQRIEEVRLIEVSSIEDASINVSAWEEEDPNKGEERVKYRIYRENWWFRDRWKDRFPNQQISMINQNAKFDIYNFDKPLTESEIVAAQTAFRIFSSIPGGVGYNPFLIDDKDEPNVFTGELLNGLGDNDGKFTVLLPAARRKIPHRIDKASNFLGTLIHEQAHSLWWLNNQQAAIDWRKTFDWYSTGKLVNLKGGFSTDEFVRQPERCINEYATYQDSEDFAESFTAAIFTPEKLDKERLNFIIERFPLEEYKGEYKTIIKTGVGIEIPRIEEVRYFKTMYPGKLRIR